MRRGGVQYASTAVRRAPMHDPQVAARIIAQISGFYPQPFDATTLVEERCGRYVRGAHQGQLRGWAQVEVVTEGGWKKHSPGERNGRVVRPGQVLSVVISDFNGKPYLEVQ